MMIDPLSRFIHLRPRTWVDDLRMGHPHLMRQIDQFSPNITVGEGWKGIVTRLLADLEEMHLPYLQIRQIKEKFGGLRVYVSGGDANVIARIRLAEAEAIITCELCSATGKLHDQEGWFVVRCDDHKGLRGGEI